ncbi:TPA: hypothetical protein I9080_002191 [Clostridium perfringens]|uniref:Uncharacterized protein n=1 Tax=Clostridium perfringens TaxID=1502 RepID=A0A8H9R033_CLOPF|nr:hypothetical protein [Clostridium perfringens]
MNLKFMDILDELELTEDNIKGLSGTIIKNDDIDILDALSDYYYEKIFNTGYCISVEELALFLDLSIEGVNKFIINNLDRLEFPPSKFKLKSKIKGHILNKYFWDKTNNSYKSTLKNGLSKVYLNDRFDKRVLYNINSLIEFLEKSTSLISDPLRVSIKFDANIILQKIKVTESFNKKRELTEHLRHILQVIINNDSNKIEYTNIKNFLNFRNYVYQILAPYKITTSNSSDDLQDISLKPKLDICLRSARSLGILFNTLYLKNINDIVNRNPNSIVLKINIDNSKNPLKRYIMAKDELLKNIEYNFNNITNYTELYNEESKELKKESLISPNIVHITLDVPKYYFSKKFNFDNIRLKNFLFNSINKNMV